jgi:hypothetical protein
MLLLLFQTPLHSCATSLGNLLIAQAMTLQSASAASEKLSLCHVRGLDPYIATAAVSFFLTPQYILLSCTLCFPQSIGKKMR